MIINVVSLENNRLESLNLLSSARPEPETQNPMKLEALNLGLVPDQITWKI